MNRTQSREEAFRLIYSLQIIKEVDVDEQLNFFYESEEITDEDAKIYVEETIKGILANREKIENEIKGNIKEGWSMERISKVDLALLKLGIYEMLFANIPYKVVINEVVELSKKYGNEKSQSFINGVLANVLKQNNIV